MAERTTIRLPRDLLVRAKRMAAEEGRTLAALIEEGLRKVLSDKRMSRRGKRILPPVSKSTGGLIPSMDLADLSALQDIDDRNYMERMRSK